MPGNDSLDSYRALRRSREVAVNELANAWNVVTDSLPALRSHLHDPEGLQILDDALAADGRARAMFEELRKLLI